MDAGLDRASTMAPIEGPNKACPLGPKNVTLAHVHSSFLQDFEEDCNLGPITRASYPSRVIEKILLQQIQ